MVRLHEVPYDGALPVDGYGPGFFRIGGTVHRGAVLIAPGAVSPWGGFDDDAPLLALRAGIDVLLIGTGPRMLALPPALRAALDSAGIGVEAMASATAARAFNIVLGEGRRAAAALLPAA